MVDVGFDEAAPICNSLMLSAPSDLSLLDGLLYTAVTKLGLKNYTQTAIHIETFHGQMDASKILPWRTTVSRGVHEEANYLKEKIFQK